MYRRIPSILTALVFTACIGCSERIWDNQYDAGSITYPRFQSLTFYDVAHYQGYNLVWFLLEFSGPLKRTCTFHMEWTRDGQVIGADTCVIDPDFIGAYLLYYCRGALPAGRYGLTIFYAGRTYAQAEKMLAEQPPGLWEDHRSDGYWMPEMPRGRRR